MNKLYVIIPVYNMEQYLRRCVDSVLTQTYGGVEAILVDDGSTDFSSEICDAYAASHPNITVLHQENGGLSEARNAGLRWVYQAADAEDYLSFLDSDDFLRPDFAEKMMGYCKNMGCGAAQCGYEKGCGTFSGPAKEGMHISSQGAEDALLGYRLRSLVAAKIFSVRAFQGLLFPKGVWNEDEFVIYRALYQAGRVAFTDEKLYYYFQREGSIMDDIAKKLKGSPRRWDWLRAYEERIAFFTALGKPEQVLRTREKICTDLILRYSEQMRLRPEERDEDCVNGRYLELYRENYAVMCKRRGIPFRRGLMYAVFRTAPRAAVLASRLTSLRK